MAFPCFIRKQAKEIMSIDFLIQLWSGTFGAIVGAVVGAVVAVVVLRRTNDNARVLNRESIAAAKAESDRAVVLQTAQFNEQLVAQGDEQRRAREIQAVAELLEFMSTKLQSPRIGMDVIPPLMVLCNRLTLNSTLYVSRKWLSEGAVNTHLAPRVLRHPLAAALVPWIAAHRFALTFPNTARSPLDEDREEDEDPTPLLPLISGVGTDFGPMHRAVELVTREMLHWNHMTDDEKVECFRSINLISAEKCSMVMAGANLLLGAADARMRLVHRIENRTDLVALNVIVKEAGLSGYVESFDHAYCNFQNVVEVSTVRSAHPDALIHLASNGSSDGITEVMFLPQRLEDELSS